MKQIDKEMLADALDIALDLANDEVYRLREAYGDRLPGKHEIAANAVDTIKDAIAVLAALSAGETKGGDHG